MRESNLHIREILAYLWQYPQFPSYGINLVIINRKIHEENVYMKFYLVLKNKHYIVYRK